MLDELGKLDPSSSVAPYRQIATCLYAVIRDAAPGTRLPSNLELAGHFRVARMTIRAAVAELARDGLVVTRQGSGVYVAPRRGPGFFDVVDAVRDELAGSRQDRLPKATVVAQNHGVSDQIARRALDVLEAEGLDRDVRRTPRRVDVDAAELALGAAVTAVEAAHASIPHQRTLSGGQRERVAALLRGLQQVTSSATLTSTAESLELAQQHLRAEAAVLDAAQLARDHLAEANPRRWAHVHAVAERAAELATHLTPHDAAVLRAAAWLHDIGYSPGIASSGFHPLDGARFLATTDTDPRVVALVAHHSAAASEAVELGLDTELAAYPDEHSIVRDLLWWCDMTTGPDGRPMTFTDRMAEVRARYGPDHYVSRAMEHGLPARAAAFERAEAWIGERRPGLLPENDAGSL
ncbi:GntR family transcriptional regulator [Pseudonocardia oroxyli]|uniref:HD domain-containing protein n=1 Tax=Pseudonocardia oroxyli TaxID=366584 RepID=A0A1G8CPY7_PSEOR|nr:GntR family transcriptional regulator [Pseudonocardia oroxyli]SDH47403.1 HD domain-containing protein [Pseudonocardia oroxyli]